MLQRRKIWKNLQKLEIRKILEKRGNFWAIFNEKTLIYRCNWEKVQQHWQIVGIFRICSNNRIEFSGNQKFPSKTQKYSSVSLVNKEYFHTKNFPISISRIFRNILIQIVQDYKKILQSISKTLKKRKKSRRKKRLIRSRIESKQGKCAKEQFIIFLKSLLIFTCSFPPHQAEEVVFRQWFINVKSFPKAEYEILLQLAVANFPIIFAQTFPAFLSPLAIDGGE